MSEHITAYLDETSAYYLLSPGQRDAVDGFVNRVEGLGGCFQIDFDVSPHLLVSCVGFEDCCVRILVAQGFPGMEATAHVGHEAALRLAEGLEGRRVPFVHTSDARWDHVTVRGGLARVMGFVGTVLDAEVWAGTED